MSAILLMSLALGLFAYAGVLSLPAYSPRRQMLRRLGPRPIGLALPAEAGGPPEPRLDRWLKQVPLTRRLAPARFRLVQAGLAGAALALALGPWLLLQRPTSAAAVLLYPPLLWFLPEGWLWLQVRRRTALLARAYPDLLAHLVTQTRAGAGTYQAFASSPPVLREPLRTEVEDLIADMRIAPFPAALERFAARCAIPEIRAFAQNVIHQQALGIALPEVLEAEEAHAQAMAKQAVRRRIQASAVVMASVTIILLLNGLLIYFTPVFLDLSRLIANE